MTQQNAQPLNVVGIVIHVAEGRTDSVRAALQTMEGVDVHADGGDGRLVVTAIDTDTSMAIDQLAAMNRTPGIVSTMLAYHHFDQPEAAQTAVPCCDSAPFTHSCTATTGA